MNTKKTRWPVILLVTLLCLVAALFAAYQFALRTIKSEIEKTLGAQGEVQEIRANLTGVEIVGLRMKAPPTDDNSAKRLTWPAADQLRAERILIKPSFGDLLTGKIGLQLIRIEGAYISMLRTREGQMKVLPGLLDTRATSKPAKGNEAPQAEKSPTAITIQRIELANGIIEFYDASIRTTPHKLRLEQITAAIDKIRLPELTGMSTINLAGVVKGTRQDGKISISGMAELASKESGLSSHLRGVDLIPFQPYLLKATEAGIKKGSLDLDLNTSLKKGILHAPGTLTIKDLELTSTNGTLMGMPRNAVVGLMKNRDGKITLKFVLDGNINDPKFSLNENMAKKFSSSMAETLGISIEGLARGVGSVGGSAAKGLSDSVGKLLQK